MTVSSGSYPPPSTYEYRARERTKKAWNGPSTGGFAHVYLAKSLLPFPRELSDLENRIELEEWRPRLDAFPRVVRGRRAAISPVPGFRSDLRRATDNLTGS